MFLKYNDKAEIISIVVVYVDDFIGTHRSDYNIKELHDSFSWGELSYFELDKEKTFKGKELTFTKNKIGKVTLQITMSKFLDTVEPLSPWRFHVDAFSNLLFWLSKRRRTIGPYLDVCNG